jgi:hypothetical protein
VLLFVALRNSERFAFTGTSGLAASVETRLGRAIAGDGSDLSLDSDEAGDAAAAAVNIEGAEASEDAIGRADGSGGVLLSDRGALLIGNG